MKSTIARIEANFNSFFEVMVLASSLIGKAVNSAIDNTLNFKLTIPEKDNIQGKNIFGFNFLWDRGLTFVENGIVPIVNKYLKLFCPGSGCREPTHLLVLGSAARLGLGLSGKSNQKRLELFFVCKLIVKQANYHK